MQEQFVELHRNKNWCFYYIGLEYLRCIFVLMCISILLNFLYNVKLFGDVSNCKTGKNIFSHERFRLSIIWLEYIFLISSKRFFLVKRSSSLPHDLLSSNISFLYGCLEPVSRYFQVWWRHSWKRMLRIRGHFLRVSADENCL